MPRILYACPDGDSPAGGIKVIYRHVELLREHAYDAFVMHMAPAFARPTWFDNTAPVLHLQDLRREDLVVVPEVMMGLAQDVREFGARYCIFVQNGYLVLPHTTLDFDEVRDCNRHAEAIFSISEDTSALHAQMFPESANKIARVQFSVDAGLFRPREKERTVLYMPRKQPVHARNVVPWLASQFPYWKFVELDGMSERDVAHHMSGARIFLAFSDFEGCPLPPIEAAISGNLVLGYSGWGGDEYWREPNFQRVEMGNLREFVRKFYEAAALASNPDIDAILAPGKDALAARYGRANEARLLCQAMDRVLARRVSA